MTDATNKTGDGGPASELSLRDWFAGQALAGMLQTEIMAAADESGKQQGSDGFTVIARLAYGYAEAMLAERAKVRDA